jgi:hypothetical protein
VDSRSWGRRSRCSRDERNPYYTRTTPRPADLRFQGHFNKPKLPPPGPDPSVLLEKVKKKMAIEAQESM